MATRMDAAAQGTRAMSSPHETRLRKRGSLELRLREDRLRERANRIDRADLWLSKYLAPRGHNLSRARVLSSVAESQ